MRQVYAESQITVLATNAAKVSDGFLHDRVRAFQCSLQWRPQDGTAEFSVTFQPSHGDRGLLDKNYSGDTENNDLKSADQQEINNDLGLIDQLLADQEELPDRQEFKNEKWASAPLRFRAWAFQEYLLSPKTLSYRVHKMQ